MGLVAALERLAKDFGKSAQVACDTDCEPLVTVSIPWMQV